MKMIALKPMRYGTRHLVAGDEFDATGRDVKILQVVKRAKVAPPTPPVDPMVALRAEYESVLGKRPFMGWDADELRRRMDEHRTVAELDDAAETDDE